jgi:aminoglycoside 2''-phosphotransferase
MSEEQLRQRINKIMPDLEIEHFERNEEGLINDIAIVNRDLVFRFAKNDGFAQILNLELDILDLIRPNVDIPVPSPVYRGPGSAVYPLVRGQALLREDLLAMDKTTRDNVAIQLGTFLHQLHTIKFSDLEWELPATMAPVTREKWLELRSRVEDKVYPLLLKHQITWAERLFDSVLTDPKTFDYYPTVIHGDLAPYHILYDPTKTKITGVIDFGVAGLGDPALDIGTLITNYGEQFVSRMNGVYPEMAAHMPRARFYAQAIELQWVLLGLETEDDFWFTAHLGTARDILS